MRDEIDELARQLTAIVASRDLTGSELKNTITDALESDVARRIGFEPSDFRDLFLDHVDLWQRMLAWLEDIWTGKSPDATRYDVARAMENISHLLAEDAATKIGFFEVVSRLVQGANSSRDLTNLVFGAFGSFGDPAVKRRVGSIILRLSPYDTDAHRAFELVCSRHSTKPWAWTLREDFQQRIPQPIREEYAISGLGSDSGNVSPAELADAFLKLVGPPETPRGRVFVENLQAGRDSFEARPR